jgi:hypothetical protein
MEKKEKNFHSRSTLYAKKLIKDRMLIEVKENT